MALIKVPGSDAFERIQAEEARNKALATRLEWVERQREACLIKDDEESEIGNYMNRLGRPMTAAELERRLLRLNKNLKFRFNEFNSEKKAMYLNKPSGPEYICAYENHVMPERSVARIVVEEIPDPAFISGQRTLERSELPDYEVNEDGTFKFDPEAARPGFLYEKKRYGEAKRGWRTVLLRLVQEGVLSVAEVEREFGSTDTAEWAFHTGKQAVADKMEWRVN